MNLVTPEYAAQMEHNKWPRQYLIPQPQPQPKKEPELFSLKKIKNTKKKKKKWNSKIYIIMQPSSYHYYKI